MPSTRTAVLADNTRGALRHMWELTRRHPLAASGLAAGLSLGLIASRHSGSSMRADNDNAVLENAQPLVSQPVLDALPQNQMMPTPVMEGYDDAPSAHIAMNGTGYDSMPRMSPVSTSYRNDPTFPVGSGNWGSVDSPRTGMTDYRYRPSERMNTILDVNNF